MPNLVQDSFGHESNTLLVATIGPAVANLTETTSTLTFAKRCMAIPSHARINHVKTAVVDYEQGVTVTINQVTLPNVFESLVFTAMCQTLTSILLMAECLQLRAHVHELERAAASQRQQAAHPATMDKGPLVDLLLQCICCHCAAHILACVGGINQSSPDLPP